VPSLEHGENKKKNCLALFFKANELGVSLHDSTVGADEDTRTVFWFITSLGDTRDSKHGVYWLIM